MGGLSSYAWRSLAARPGRTVLTIIGVALGVAVLFAALATNAGIETAVERTVRDLVGRADLRIEAFAEAGLSPETVATIAETTGVAVAAPALVRRTYLSPDPARPPGGATAPVTVLGVDPTAEPKIHDLGLVSGVPLGGSDADGALISERMARDAGYRLGDQLTLQGADEPKTVRISGILAGDGPLVGAAGRTVVIPLDEAQTLLGVDGVTRIDVLLESGVSLDAVSQELESRLRVEPYVLSSRADVAASLRASTADFRALTALVAAISLFAGAFLIFNTLSMTVAERAREIGLLRAAGATRGQLNAVILLEAVPIGLLGAGIGLVLGAGLAWLVVAYLRATDIVAVDDPSLDGGGVALAFGLGLLVTIAAAIEPALRAGRISPVEALRPSLTGRSLPARLRWLVVVFAAVAVAGVLLVSPVPGNGPAVRWLVLYGLLLLVVLLTPVLLGPLGRLAGLPFRILAPAAERLTRGSLIRDRSRTTLTVGVLTIGVAMIVALSTAAQSARESATAWLERVVPGDVVATSIRPVALDEEVAQTLAAVPGVARVSPIARFQVALAGRRLEAAAVVGADLLTDGRLDVVDGNLAEALPALDNGGTTIVPRGTAERLGLHLGDTLPFAVGGGRTVPLRVGAIVDRTIPGQAGDAILVGWKDATEAFGVAGADAFAIRYAPGAAAAAGPQLEAVARGQALEPTPLGQIAGAVDDALARVFALFDALALVAVVVAGLGIVNTLTMNVLERVRELGVLRATGMTRQQVWRMVVVEAGVLGVVGTLLGCVTGLVVGRVLAVLTSGGGPVAPRLAVDWTALLATAAFGIIVAILAAVWPARLASRLEIVQALQYE